VTTATTAGRQPLVSDRKDSFARLLRSEWTKFQTVRGWVIASFAAAVVLALLGLFSASGSHSSDCGGQGASYSCTGSPAIPLGPGGEPVADSYYFVHQPLTGDDTITVHVTSLTGVIGVGNSSAAGPGANAANTRPGLSDWAKAGLLITDNTNQGATYAAVMATGSHGVRMQYDYTHDIPAPEAAGSATSAHWLRVTRDGATVTAYESTDDAHWIEIGVARLPGLTATVQAGMFVTSPTTTQITSSGSPSLATATFTNVRVSGGFASGTWRGQTIGGGGYYPTLSAGGYHSADSTFTLSGSGDISPAVTGGILGDETITSTLSGVFAGLFVLIVLGALFITSEYRRGLIRTTLAASPRRGRVLAAKALVIGSAAFVAGLAGTIVAVLVGEHILRANGNAIYPASTLTQFRVIVGTAAMLALAAVAALAVGTIMRSSAGAVAALSATVVLPYILVTSSALPAGAATWLARLTPAAGFAVQQTVHQYTQVSSTYTPANGYFPLAPWAGFAVLWGYTAVALGVAWLMLDRRDA
jgi:ABC-type transport system involved in multi-copper enzyme maturation permease subunit